jgi:hypothetical protein
VASQNFFHIHRSAKRCLEILDELFGRDRRASNRIRRSGYAFVVKDGKRL